MEKPGETPDINPNRNYLERPRLNAMLREAINYPLIIVCAGSGYGKTHAVHSFIKEYRTLTTWLEISERDNNATRFWESYTSKVSLLWPDVGARLLEIGFPETAEAFLKYDVLRREVAMLPGKHIRVFDDIHLLNNPAVIRFFERSANSTPPDQTLILITRTMPDINMIGMIMRGKVFTIQEDALCFTEDEIQKYYTKLKLRVTNENIRNIHNDTQGWALAVNLIGSSMGKDRRYERYALDAMKKNIFRFIEAEISLTVSESLLRFLLRISLIDHLTSGLIKILADDDSLIEEMEKLNAYIRYDFSMDTYMIHHLLRDYLRKMQEQILADDERRETYQAAGEWCEGRGYHMDAFSYYEKSGDYDAITRNVATLNVQIAPDMARYALEIFERAPEEVKFWNPLYPSMLLKLKINLGQFDEASAIAEKYANDYGSRPESPGKNKALTAIYGFWGLLRMIMSTYTDNYDFVAYYKKIPEYFYKSPFRPIGQYKAITSSAWASHVGTNRPGAMEEFIAAISCSIPYVSKILNGYYDGFEELVRGELCYFRGEYMEAEQYLSQAIDRARAYDQYVTQNRSLVYLMQIAVIRGDFASANMNYREMEALLNEKFYSSRYTMYDIGSAFYLIAMGQPENIPEWLKSDFSPYAYPSFLENYANRVKVRYHYETRKYETLLQYIENDLEKQTILFGRIEHKAAQVMCLYKLRRRSEAIAKLAETFELAEWNNIITPFIRYGKDMHAFVSSILKDYTIFGDEPNDATACDTNCDTNCVTICETCPIPRMWLEDISSRSSIFAKRKAKVISEYRLANNLEDNTELTEREIAILKDLADGHSRIEIAANRNIQINTVKIAINSIYEKLYAANLPEAIHAAVDRKII